uniref:Uncharacterized protein n=1 Tax=Tanacetum cinerariifolium TaxID=118510 RepID=A0A6L2NR43_TANCI|nr:hypothetical protein [Tanacetum cinerariifolium]
MLTACYLLNRVPNKRNKITPYKLWYKKRPNLSYLRVWGCRAVVRLPDPKRKTLSEKGIDCIFVGYVEHSKAYRFYVIEPNDSMSINSMIESRDAIFDENRVSSIPRTRFLNLVKEDLRTYDEAMQSLDATFWKKAINDEIGSIMENNTWVLSNLPPGYKPLGIHNLVIHQIHVKTTFLNGDLDEEVYMKQPEGFAMPCNEHKVCKLVNSFYGLKRAPKQWHQNFDEVVLSSGFHLNQSDKCVYSKFDYSEKLKPNTGKPVDQLEYSRAIGCLMYDITSTRPDIAYAVGRLSRFIFYEWMGVLAWGGAISWASRKKTCITGSTMESEFVALVAVCKEAEWLRNLIHEIPIWPKPIAPISI